VTVGVCIPTVGRPQAVERALRSLAEQQLRPEVVLVVDASDDGETEDVCRRSATIFGDGVLRHIHTTSGLPGQRCIGIEALRAAGVRYVCMLDDDVTLAPDFLSRAERFLESEAGSAFGGISGYDAQGWGEEFERLERVYARLGLYDGDVRPGRWLYCGRFLEVGRLKPFAGIYETEFIPGGHTVWRTEVFDYFLPPRDLRGYALLEDKHLSLRVRTRYALGVLGGAVVLHDRVGGGRPGRVRMGFMRVRREALLLRDCDPEPTLRRYAAFLGFVLVDLAVRSVVRLSRLRWWTIPDLIGSAAGWVSCVIRPPGPTRDALTAPRTIHRRLTARP
jgi:glycosyltransferase involved in cell wall biosynthesis